MVVNASLAQSIDEIELDRELCKRSFKHFVKKAWPYVEPVKPFRDGKHINVYSDHLTAVKNFEICKLIFNVPPGHSKSTMLNIMYPAWCWTLEPGLRFMAASYTLELSLRDAIKMRELIKSDWYQKRWGNIVQISPDKDTQKDFWTTKRGQRYTTSVDGGGTGFHADIQLIDDPISAGQATSEIARDHANRWISETLSTRWVTGVTPRQVIIMQRLHENDPTGYLLSKGGYEHVCLREEYEPGIYSTSLGNYEWRTDKGELLWPEVVTPAIHATRKEDLGEYGTAGQLQQRPAPAEGGLIKIKNFRWYTAANKQYEKTIISADLRFKDSKDTGDYVTFGVFGKTGSETDILHFERERLSFTESVAMMKALHRRYPEARTKLVENKANGPALVSQLKRDIPGLILVEPCGSKVERVHAYLPYHDAGNIGLPEPLPGKQNHPWVDWLLAECVSFPKVVHDDMIDAMTQAVIYLYQSGKLDFIKAMGSY